MADPIGQVLSAARETRDMSLTAVARATRIPAASIQALEDGRFEDLPAPVFVRGFLKGYCREVGLDPEDVLVQYDAYLREQEIIDDSTTKSLGPMLMPRAELADPSHRGLEISHVLLVLLAIVTFLIAYLTAGIPSQDAVDNPQSAQSQQSSLDNR